MKKFLFIFIFISLFALNKNEFFDLIKRSDINQSYYAYDKINNSYTKTTFLITAIDNGYLDIAKYLINHGADINKSNKYKETPLLTALRNQEFKFAKYLISKGANLSSEDVQGNNALTYSIKFNQNDIALKVIDKIDIHQLLPIGILKNKVGYSQSDIYFIDPKARKFNYLHLAVKSGNIEMIKSLLKSGLNIEDKAKTKITPLQMAILYQNVKVVKFLIEHGANPYWHPKNNREFDVLPYLNLISPNSQKNKIEIQNYLLSLKNSSWFAKNTNKRIFKLCVKRYNQPLYKQYLDFVLKYNKNLN